MKAPAEQAADMPFVLQADGANAKKSAKKAKSTGAPFVTAKQEVHLCLSLRGWRGYTAYTRT